MTVFFDKFTRGGEKGYKICSLGKVSASPVTMPSTFGPL